MSDLSVTIDWEIEAVTSFFNLLYSNIPHRESRDRLIWQLKGNVDFDVRSVCDALRGPCSKSFPGKSISCVKAPAKFLSLFGR